MSRWWLPAAAVLLLGTACGSGGANGPAIQRVTVVGNDMMKFVPARIVVHPGTVVVTLRDVGDEPHNIDFPQLHIKSPVIQGGQSTSVTLHLKSERSYDFDCDIHITEGMVGTLVVS